MRLWFLGLAVAFMLGACQTDNGPLPEALLGTWTTDAPRYRDRFFELTLDHLTFGTGGGTSSRNPITYIERTEENGRPLYHIEHLGTEGQPYTFSFYYEPESGAITLKNQTHIQWKKEEERKP